MLTHQFDAPYSEATIAVSIFANTDPERVKERGGFSLLDLKRFAEAVGFSATGYAELTLEDLADSGGPVIGSHRRVGGTTAMSVPDHG